MIEFWLALGGLTLLAVLIGIWPLLQQRRQIGTRSDRLNQAITRQRLSELDNEVNEGVLSPQDRAQAEEEIKAALVLEQGDAEGDERTSAKPFVTGLVIAAVVAAVTYGYANSIDQLQHWEQANDEIADLGRRIVVEADPTVTPEELSDFALALRTRLQRDPNAPEGWLLLGRLHTSLNRTESAIEAFDKSLALDPDRTSTRISLAEALVRSGQEHYLERAVRLIQTLQAEGVEDDSLTGMLAIAAAEIGDIDLAVDSWQTLAQGLSTNDPMQQQIEQRIAELKGEVTAIQVKVSVSEAADVNLPVGGMVVVFARDSTQQQGMPVAVVRRPIADFPMTVTLSDADGIMPTQRLSDLKVVNVVARVSQDGDVMPSAGEWQGSSEVTLNAGKAVSINIQINKEIE